jgi:FkbM family methyltransferase
MKWSRILVPLAQAVYRITPSRAIRRLAYDTFARSVRNRHVITTIDGVRFDLDLGEVIDLSLYLRRYEPEVAAAVRRYTRPGDTVFDIGANIGAHALSFAHRVGPEGRVIAFEPTDYGFAKLTRNLALNDFPHVTAVKVALADRRSGPQQVNFRASWMTGGGRKDGDSTVPFEMLDAWCRDNAVVRVDLIKLDVDGNEFPLMLGAREIIERCRPMLFMEAVGLHFDDPSRNPFILLSALGYRFRDLKSGHDLTIEAMRERLPRNDPGMTVSMNVLATPSEKETGQ